MEVAKKGWRKFGLAEVRIELHAEEKGDPCHDIDASRKIPVELDGVEEHGENSEPRIALVVVESGIHKVEGVVRKDHFLEKSPQNFKDRGLRAFAVKGMRSKECLSELPVSADRTLHDLRKEGDEEGKSEERFFRFYTFPAYIQKISHGLECVK